MAMQTINLGNIANDGTGDDLRTAFEKVNNNFNEITQTYASVTNAANVGDVGVGVFKDKTQFTLNFKKLNGIDGIKLTVVDDVINIGSDPLGNLTVNSIDAENGFYGNLVGNVTGNVIGTVFPTETNPVIGYGNIVGKNGVITSPGAVNYSPATIDGISVQDLNRNVTNFDFGTIYKTFNNPISYLLSEVGVDMGTITNPAPFAIDAGIGF